MTTTKIENISETKKKINIEVPNDKVLTYFKKAYQKVGQKAKVNGFRAGKVPTNILDKHYGPEIGYESLNFLISDTYTQALMENEFVPLADPKFDAQPIEKEGVYKYSVEIEIKPKFDLKDYKGIEIKKKDTKISAKEIEEELKRLQESLAQLAPAKEDDKLKKGFVATIDFAGTIDGKSFDGGTAKDYVFEFGTGQLLEDFEKGIQGMKKGDKKEIEVTFPEDYFEKSLAGKASKYDIELKNLHTKSLPKLDDELAKDIGKENLDEVKEELKKTLEARKEREHRNDYVEQAKEKILKGYKFELPQGVIETEIERTKGEKKDIEEKVKLELILEAIAKQEKIQATAQDVESRIAMLAQMYRQPVNEIRKIYQENNMIGMLATQIVLDKTLDFIIDNAKMV